MTTSSFIYDPTGLMIFLVGLSLAPFIAMMVTSYIKLVIVMNLLRQALGLQQVPPNMVINGLAVILTLYIMAPTLQESLHRIMESNAVLDARKTSSKTFQLPEKMRTFASKNAGNDAQWLAALNANNTEEGQRDKVEELKTILNYTKQPLVDFLLKHSSSRHRSFFTHIAKTLWPKHYLKNLQEKDLIICIPAFVLSELTAAFEIGFIVYLPFIAIDLVISNILLAMGMMMVSPMTISLPFKLMLFVLVNGWDKLIEALALTYR